MAYIELATEFALVAAQVEHASRDGNRRQAIHLLKVFLATVREKIRILERQGDAS